MHSDAGLVSRLSAAIIFLAVLAFAASAAPLLLTDGAGQIEHVSVRGETVLLHGYGPYRHMPADIAVQGLAQDLVTMLVAVPALLWSWWQARSGSRVGRIALTGVVAYLFVQYVLYLAMATYNELFVLWVALVLTSSQVLARLLLIDPPTPAREPSATARRFVGLFLLVNGVLITLLWLSLIVPPLLDGTLYPAGLAHLTTMVVQGFDLALFLPPSLIAGYAYLRARPTGELLAPVYTVFLSLQMTALLAKIVWMNAVGATAGPALIIIPALLVGALVATALALGPFVVRPVAPAT